MAATPRAAARAHTNSGQHVMTWLGLRSPHAATPKLRRMPRRVPFAKSSPTGRNVSRGQFPIQCPLGENLTHQAAANASAEPAPQ
jgi:hypothetical protein